jgi:uroporphyrinogen-III synthase
VLEIPFIRIQRPRSYAPLDAALRNLASYDWLILTSVNGVDALWQRAGNSRITKKHFAPVKIAAIGPATENALLKLGLNVDVIPKEYVAESVVRSLRRRVKGKRVLLVRAKIARDVIPRQLRAAGAQVDVVEAYETVVPESSRRRLRSALQHPRRLPDIVTFTSSSTVRNFVALLAGDSTLSVTRRSRALNSARFPKTASIGPVTSATLRELGLRVDIQAREYTIPGLIAAIVESAATQR